MSVLIYNAYMSCSKFTVTAVYLKLVPVLALHQYMHLKF